MEKTGIKSRSTQRIIWAKVRRDFIMNRYIYIMCFIGLLYYVMFRYGPMYGAIIAFKDFSPSKGILGSPWVGFKHFINFFEGHYFRRLVMNTLMINVYDLIFGFPAPIILALLINEVKSKFYKRTVQTISYLPHFISLVVICGIIVDFTAKDGIISQLISIFGGEKRNLLLQPQLFKTIYVSTNIWQSMGWSSIIYLAALSGIDPHLYEAATTDGANRWRQTISITIPGILPTVFTLLVLRIGQMMNVGFEKIFLLYNPVTYETADVISTFVYRVGLLDANFSYSAAVGLFNSVINFALVIIANNLSRRFNEASLW